jgi:O-antigen biosynthesis protein
MRGVGRCWIGFCRLAISSMTDLLKRVARRAGLRLQQLARLGRAAGESVQFRGGVVPAIVAIVRSLRLEGGATIFAKLRAHTTGAAHATAAEQARRYRAWMRTQDRLDAHACKSMAAVLEGWQSTPTMSVFIATCVDPSGQSLARSVESVRRQVYPHWELWLPAPACSQSFLDAALDRSSSDARINILEVASDTPSEIILDRQLAGASGDFVIVLGSSDELHPMALYWIASEIQRHPAASVVYSDEDSINGAGQRSDPYFKCDFNYELLLAQDMFSRLGAYRRSLLDEIGGFISGYSTCGRASGHDLALRATERCEPDRIRHVPKVLYHRRINSSTAEVRDSPGRSALAAGQSVVQAHLARVGVAGEVTEAPDAPGMYRVRFPIPSLAPEVELIIPTRDQAGLLENCVRSVIERTGYRAYRICIVDNGSTEAQTLALFARWQADPRIRILRDERPFNFSVLNNAAVASSASEFVCLLNNDVEVMNTDWLDEMVSHAIRPRVGCVGARLWYPDDTLQHGGIILGLGGVAGHAHKHLPRGASGYFGRAVLLQSLSAVTAACLLIRRRIYQQVGGLDEALAVAFNDVDFCLRVREAGFRNIWTPYAELYHHESVSRGPEDNPEKRSRFRQEIARLQQKWGATLSCDPAYSPNLTTIAEDFSIAPGWRPTVTGPLDRKSEERANGPPGQEGSTQR